MRRLARTVLPCLRAERAPFGDRVPTDPRSPWPKFRRDAAQTGRSPVRPSTTGGAPWAFPTGKGIFSTPVIGPDRRIYVGSADRTFYALERDGTVAWTVQTGEIIDSAALLDDAGVVYFGSGDGTLYARRAGSGAEVWAFDADPPAATGAFIDWFEANVAMGPDRTLYVPNDNFLTYAIDPETRAVRWRFQTADQTWSLPAVDPERGLLFMGNNNLLALLGPNTFAIDAASGETRWSHATDGTIAASPMLTPDGLVVVGGFDGWVRAYDADTGRPVSLESGAGTRDDRAPPLARRAVPRVHPRARQRERRRAQARRQRPGPRPMPVALTLRAHPRGLRRAQHRVELLLHELLDRVADPHPHHRFDRVRPKPGRFRGRLDLAIAVHGVILRLPPPSGSMQLWVQLRRMMTPSLFHHKPDTTTSFPRSTVTANARADAPTAVVTLPPVPKVPSRVPSSLYRTRTKL